MGIEEPEVRPERAAKKAQAANGDLTAFKQMDVQLGSLSPSFFDKGIEMALFQNVSAIKIGRLRF